MFKRRNPSLVTKFKRKTVTSESDWVQPVLTSNTSYGTITCSSSSQAAWHISDGLLPSTGYTNTWETNNESQGWVNWKFPVTLAITKIRVYQRNQNPSHYTEKVAIKTKEDGDYIVPLTDIEQGNDTFIEYEFECPVITDNLYFYVEGTGVVGIGEVEITATQLVLEDIYYESLEEASENTTPVYYKNVYTDWEQPVFTSDSTWGKVYGTNTYNDSFPWKALNGSLDMGSGNNNWATNSEGGTWGWDFDKTLCVSNIRIYQRGGSGTYPTGAVFVYTDSTKKILIGTGTPAVEDNAYIDISVDNLQLKGIYIEVQGYGFGQLQLTAQTITRIESNADDYTVIRYKDEYGNISDIEPKEGIARYYVITEGDFEQPVLTSNGIMGGDTFACNQSTYLSEDRKAYKAFNGDNDIYNDNWHSDGSGLPHWIEWYNPIPLKISKLTVRNRDNDGSFPCDYILSYSDDGNTYIDITCGTSSNQTAYAYWDIFVNATEGHKYWRLTITKASGSNLGYVAIQNIAITAVTYIKEEVKPFNEYNYIEFIEVTKDNRDYYKHYNFIRNGKRYDIQRKNAIYLNWVPWTMPVLVEDGIIYNLSKDKNYGAAASSVYKKYNGTNLHSQSYAFHAFNYLAGTKISNIEWWSENSTDAYETLVFHSPALILLKGIGLYITNDAVAKIDVLGSYDGINYTAIGTINSIFGNGTIGIYEEGYSPICAHREGIQGVYIPKNGWKACKYIALKFYRKSTASASQIHAAVLFHGSILDTANWTDNELFEWEMPIITEYITQTDDGNITVIASSEQIGSPAWGPLSDGSNKYNHIGNGGRNSWCPDPNLEGSNIGWLCIKFPYKIAITKLVHNNLIRFEGDTDNYTNGQYFADEAMETPIGNAFSCNSLNDTEKVVFSSSSPIITDTIFFRKTGGGRYGGINKLAIEAQKLSFTEADSESAQYVVSSQGALPSNKEDSGSFLDFLLIGLQLVIVIGSLALAAWTDGASIAVGSVLSSAISGNTSTEFFK